MKNYKLIKNLKKHNSVCIIGHLEPDADALSSMIVLKNFLTKHFKIERVDMFTDYSKFPENCLNIIKPEEINPSIKEYSAAIMIDTPNKVRLGKYKTLFEQTKETYVIDHHVTNDNSGNFNIIEIVPSTSEIIYSIAKEYKYKLSKEEKGYIYSGLITDTNNFTTPNLTKRTFKIVSEIVSNINYVDIYNNYFNKSSMNNFKLLAKSINNIESIDENKIIITHVTESDLSQINASFDDLTGIINKLSTISGNILTCLIQPKDAMNYVSMRAKKGYDISGIAKAYGGGGHSGAAAFITDKEINEIKILIKQEFLKILNI